MSHNNNNKKLFSCIVCGPLYRSQYSVCTYTRYYIWEREVLVVLGLYPGLETFLELKNQYKTPTLHLLIPKIKICRSLDKRLNKINNLKKSMILKKENLYLE